jgi:hypothetical protein
MHTTKDENDSFRIPHSAFTKEGPMKRTHLILASSLAAVVLMSTTTYQPSTSACGGSRGSVCTVSQTACLKTMVLAKAVPSVVVLPAATPVTFNAPANLFIACPTQNNCGGPCVGGGAFPTSASLTVSLYPFPCAPPLPAPTATGTISTTTGTMAVPICSASGAFNSYTVPVNIPAGTPRGTYCVAGAARVTFSDGTVLTATGDTVVCLVEPCPGQPGRPRLDVQLITPTFPRLAPGDQTVAEYRITNCDTINAVTLTGIADSQQTAVRPQGANESQGVFAIANPFGDDFPVAFDPPTCLPLPAHPYSQGPIRKSLGTLGPGQSTTVRVGIRSFGQCASGSCNESSLRVQGRFSDGTPALGCAAMSLYVDTTAPTTGCGIGENDCNRNGIPDAEDISSGRSVDQNFNATPDECEDGAPFIPQPVQVTPPTVEPGGTIHARVTVFDDVAVTDVWANGRPLANRGGGLWEGDIPADDETGPQTVYVLARDSDGQIATHIGLYQVGQLPVLTVFPTSLSFNTIVGQGNPSPQSFTVLNSGTGPLTFTIASSDSSLVFTSPTGGTLPGGQSTQVQAFVNNPNAVGTRNATLTITAPGAQNSPVFVPVTVTTTAPPAILDVAPTSLVFNTVAGQGNPPGQSVTVRNLGSGQMTFSISSSDPSLAFTTLAGGTLLGGQATQVTVLVNNPNVAGTRAATLTITAPDAQNSPKLVSVTIITTAPPGVLDVNPTSLTFNAVIGQGNPAAQTFAVTNTGGGSLSFNITSSDITLITTSPTSGTLTSGQATQVQVFATNPNVAGTRTATITVTAPGAQNSPRFVSVTVQTSPPPPALDVTPTSLTFNTVVGGGNPAPQTITVENTGGSPLSFTIASSNTGLVTASPTSGTLNAGQSTSVQVSVTAPATPGTRNATLTVSAPAAQNSPRTVSVRVVTTAPPTLSVSPTSLAFNAVVGGGDPPSRTLTVQNSGGGSFTFTITSSNTGLVTASPMSGTLNAGQSASVQVSVDNPNVAGTQTATLTIAAPGAQNSPASVSITLTVVTLPTGDFGLVATDDLTLIGGLPGAGVKVMNVATQGRSREVAVAPNGSFAVALNRENSVSVLRITGGSIDETRVFDLGDAPMGVAITGDSSLAVVVTENPVAVTLIRNLPNSPTASTFQLLNPGSTARDIALTPDGDTAVITGTATAFSGVSVVDGLRTGTPVLRGQVRTGPDPRGVAIGPDGDTAFVVDMRNNQIAVVINIANGTPMLDRGSPITAGVGASPRAIKITPDGSTALVTNQGGGDVSLFRVNGRSLLSIGTVNVGSAPAGLSISSDGNSALVANSGDSTVTVIVNLRGGPSAQPPITGLSTEAAEQSVAFIP